MHDIGVNAASGTGAGLVCDCGEHCENLTAWHAHTVRTFNNPDAAAIELRGDHVHQAVIVDPGQAGLIIPCTKIACARQGNNRECWTLEIPGPLILFELPSRQVAEDLAVRGGVVAGTYILSTC